MEFKKCARCGCFFASPNDVCCICEARDKQDIYNLNSYIVTSPASTSIESLSFDTGVSVKNISRFFKIIIYLICKASPHMWKRFLTS